jgi:AraC family transcriptional regulator of adaptative response / DNA-3-methyladenine glycosylase II
MPSTHAPSEALESDACYLAMKTHDARFDGSFFTAVTSTGIYCRPVCRVKLPRRENCRFFVHAAQAEAEGFRPCLRCRPELAPRAASWSTEDASRILALQAARLIDEPDAWVHGDDSGPGAAQVAARLGVSDRHLRRIFEAQFGVSPLQYLQTRRLLAAKQLIADTRLPMTQVALASGFASVRRFNAAFVEHYGLNPSALRRAGGAQGGTPGREAKAIEVRLGFRPPYDVNAMLGFFARRALRGVEVATTADGKAPAKGQTPTYVRLARTLRVQQGAQAHAGWLQLRFDIEREQMLLSVSDSLAAVLPIVISRARAMLDLDAEPMAINAALHDGLSARRRSSRAGHGRRLRARGARGAGPADHGGCGAHAGLAAGRGVRRTDRHAHRRPGQACSPHRLPLPRPAAMRSGNWASCDSAKPRCRPSRAKSPTASWRCMRAPTCPRPSPRCRSSPASAPGPRSTSRCARLRWPDAFPAGDIALQKALGVTTARAAGEASQAWRPWRSYAVLRAWHAPSLPLPRPSRKWQQILPASQRQASPPEMS